jgi:hypothetical protein
MPVPWLRLLDVLIGVLNLTQGGAARAAAAEDAQSREPLGETARRAERERMDMERERMEAERQRAERAMKLRQLHRAADREIDRLRLMAGIAAAGLIGTLVFFGQLIGTIFAALRAGTRLTMIGGWVLLLAALVLSLSLQAAVARSAAQIGDPGGNERPGAGRAGALIPWIIALGLALIGLAAFTT